MKYIARIKYTTRDEHEVKPSAIFYSTQESDQELYTFMQTSGSVLLCCTLTKVSAKYSSSVILTHSLNTYMVFFDKMCQ